MHIAETCLKHTQQVVNSVYTYMYFVGLYILLQNVPHVTHWIQYCITTSETVQGVFDYWRLNVTERAKIWVFLCLVLITFASIHLLTTERAVLLFLRQKAVNQGKASSKALSGCSLLRHLSKSISFISFVTVFVTRMKSLAHFDTNITI